MVISSRVMDLQNPWWGDPSAIDRDQYLLEIAGRSYEYHPPLVDSISLEAGDIHVIRGPRQVGKTTAIKLIVKKLLADGREPASIVYLSCESFKSFEDLQPVLVECLAARQAGRAHLFLDEISFVSEWQRAVLAVANMGLLRNASLVLTGSNARDLKQSSERLPGRRGKGRDHKLYPLSIIEMGELECFTGKGFGELLDIYMAVGGFPRAIADFVTLGKVTDAVYETYRNWVAGDAQRYGLRQETLKQILFRISETMASRVTWPVLIADSPVRSHETALEYVEHLQDAFLCSIHYCYDGRTKGPAYQKARKIFFIDPLLHVIAATWREGIPNCFDWMTERLNDADFRGRQLESAVVNHAGRMYDRVYFWYSTKQKKEIDLIIPLGRKVVPFEVKLRHEPAFRAMGKEVEILHPKNFPDFLKNPPRA